MSLFKRCSPTRFVAASRRAQHRTVIALWMALSVTVSSSTLWADSLSAIATATPEKVGLSPARLERIGKTFQAYVDRGEAAGALALIARRGKVAYVESWGDRDREADQPMTADTIFRIYSMTKPITSVAVMMLHEEGHFFLTDPITDFLPELANLQVQSESRDPITGEKLITISQATRPITILDLLRHTAGFSYGFFGDTQVDEIYRRRGVLVEDKTIAETVDKLSDIPLRFEPGRRWHYSVSVDVLGRLIEVVSKQSLDQFLRERMFEPLSMNDTGFFVPASKRDRLAQLYKPAGLKVSREAFLDDEKISKQIEVLNSEDVSSFSDATTHFSGGGGLVSTAADYLRFCQMMLDGGQLHGRRVLSRKTVELMTSDHLNGIPGFDRPGRSFGLGFQVVKDLGASGSLGSPGVYAWGGAAGTRFWIDPQEELIGIFMVQIMPHRTRMGDEFRLLTYQAIDD